MFYYTTLSGCIIEKSLRNKVKEYLEYNTILSSLKPILFLLVLLGYSTNSTGKRGSQG